MFDNTCSFSLRDFFLFRFLENLTSNTHLNNENELIFIIVNFIKFYDIGMIEHFHDVKLSKEFCHIIIFHKSFPDNFSNSNLVGELGLDFSDNSKPTFTNDIFYDIILLEIFFLFHFDKRIPFHFNVLNTFVVANSCEKTIRVILLFEIRRKKVIWSDSFQLLIVIVDRRNVVKNGLIGQFAERNVYFNLILDINTLLL